VYRYGEHTTRHGESFYRYWFGVAGIVAYAIIFSVVRLIARGTSPIALRRPRR